MISIFNAVDQRDGKVFSIECKYKDHAKGPKICGIEERRESARLRIVARVSTPARLECREYRKGE